jgi:TRAP-type C4-dicarboxylate transport system permease small subunit
MNHLDPVVAVVGVLALLGVLAAFRSGARAGSKVARQTREVSRMGGTLTRALATGAVIVGVQWAVIVSTTDPRAWALTLGLPAVFAGSALARVFVVTTVEHGERRRGARR